MRPISLTLTNFIGIRSGLGRDELSLNIDALTDGAKLVAIVGPNGSAKTTVLENLQPYRLMPSRAGGYSPGSFSYYDHIGMGKSGKEFLWEHNGKTYRSSLIFNRTAKTKKTEAYMHEQSGDDWVPVVLPDNTVSDGKADTYDRCVEHILGSPELFFTAAFSAQGRKSLSTYTNGDIKGLLTELLGLEHITNLGAKSKDVTKGITLHLDAMRGDLARIGEQEAELSTAQEDMNGVSSELKLQTEAKSRARLAVGEASRALAEVQADENANTETEIRRTDLTRRLESARNQVAATEKNASQDAETEEKQQTARETAIIQESNWAKQQHDTDTQATQKSRYDAESQAETDITGLENQITEAKDQISRNRTLLTRRDEVDQAKAATPGLSKEAEESQAALEEAKVAHESVREIQQRAQRIDDSLRVIQRDGKQLAAQCEALKARSALAGEVPCQGTDLQGKCKLLSKSVIEAQDGIPQAETDIAAKRTEYSKEQATLKGLQKEIAAAGNTNSTVKQAETALDQIQQRIRENDALVALESSINQASDAIAHAEQQITTWQEQIIRRRETLASTLVEHDKHSAALKVRLDEMLSTLRERLEADTKTALDRISEIRQRAKTICTGIREEIARVEQELSLLPPPSDTSALDQAQAALEAAESSLSQAEQAVTGLNTRAGTLTERIRGLEKALAGAEEAKAKATHLEDEIAHWTALTKAFGNDGIIALTIDDAGPTLAALTNDLLLACYGPRFSIAIRTQAENAKGDLKETFDIIAFDAERGDEKSVRAMSGGEKIWIQEAITRAMALYQAQTSGRKYGCQFADESDGALDPKRKQQYMEMKRKAMELGGYEKEIFISHTPELWEMADAVIDMADYRQ